MVPDAQAAIPPHRFSITRITLNNGMARTPPHPHNNKVLRNFTRFRRRRHRSGYQSRPPFEAGNAPSNSLVHRGTGLKFRFAMLTRAEIVRQLSKSQIFLDYEAAFNTATQLPLAFRPHEVCSMPCGAKRMRIPFVLSWRNQVAAVRPALKFNTSWSRGSQANPRP